MKLPLLCAQHHVLFQRQCTTYWHLSVTCFKIYGKNWEGKMRSVWHTHMMWPLWLNSNYNDYLWVTKQQKQCNMNQLTRNIVPACTIGDAIFKGFAHGIGTVWLAGLHHRVVVGIHQCQVAKQNVVLCLAVVALLLVEGWVIKRVAGNHRATVQVRWQHKSGETMAYCIFKAAEEESCSHIHMEMKSYSFHCECSICSCCLWREFGSEYTVHLGNFLVVRYGF